MRPAKAKEYQPELESDILRSLLDSDVNVNEIEEWFREPWRDSRQAARLALEAALCVREPGKRDYKGGPDSAAATAWATLMFAASRGSLTSDDYEQAERLQVELGRSPYLSDVFLCGAVRIIGNWIANSDGGGHVPNAYLVGSFWPAVRDGLLEEDVARAWAGKHRAIDYGLDWMGSVDPDRSFRWLWLNGRYRLATIAALTKRPRSR